MSLRNSEPVLLSEFDLWSEPPTQICVDRGYFTEHRPHSVVDIGAPLEFTITTAEDEYLFLSESLFGIKIQLETIVNDVRNCPDDMWDKICPVNNLMHSMINSLNLEINGKEIIKSQQNYAYKSYFETILGFSKDAKSSHLRSQLFFSIKSLEKDPDRKRFFNPVQSSKEKSRIADMLGKLHIDLAEQDRALIGGCELKISIRFNRPSFFLERGDLADDIGFKVNILDTYISLYRFKVSDKLITHHHKILSKKPAIYPLTRSEIRTFSVLKGAYEACIDNIYIGQLPRRMFMTMIDTRAYTGLYTLDPYAFSDFNANHVCVYYDGVQFPSRPYTPNFNNLEFTREYYSLFQAIDQNVFNPLLSLTMNEYMTRFPVFAWNFTPDLSHGFGSLGHLSMIKRGSLSLEVKYRKPLQQTINLIIFAEFDSVIEIDKDKNVNTDYN